jgi:uncharacterized membrane protein YoaK (UPF0700 family)
MLKKQYSEVELAEIQLETIQTQLVKAEIELQVVESKIEVNNINIKHQLDLSDILNELGKVKDDNNSKISYTKTKRTIQVPLPLNLKTSREFLFFSLSGCCFTFNSGYLNGCSIRGFKGLSDYHTAVAGITGGFTKVSIFIANNEYDEFWTNFYVICCFIFGGFISGIFIPNAKPLEISPEYGPLFLLIGIILVVSALVTEYDGNERLLWCLLALANGIQNGMISMYSNNLIRSTHITGGSTDIGMFVGQMIRGNNSNIWKLLLIICLTLSFCCGAALSQPVIDIYGFKAIIPNTIFMLLVGTSSIIFVANEFNISFWEALSNTGGWDQAIIELDLKDKTKEEIDLKFNQIDSHHTEYIDVDELGIAIEERKGEKVSSKYLGLFNKFI